MIKDNRWLLHTLHTSQWILCKVALAYKWDLHTCSSHIYTDDSCITYRSRSNSGSMRRRSSQVLWRVMLIIVSNRIRNCTLSVKTIAECMMHRSELFVSKVRMAERSKALRSGRSLVLQAWVRIPLLTNKFLDRFLKSRVRC